MIHNASMRAFDFQPALPMRGVTVVPWPRYDNDEFNPHSPCGE